MQPALFYNLQTSRTNVATFATGFAFIDSQRRWSSSKHEFPLAVDVFHKTFIDRNRNRYPKVHLLETHNFLRNFWNVNGKIVQSH